MIGIRADFSNENNHDFMLTNNINEAIFMDFYGNMIWGEFDMGMRGLDHNCILDGSDHETTHFKKWENVHEQEIIRIVPETKVALIMDFQQPSERQLELIKDNNFIIEYY